MSWYATIKRNRGGRFRGYIYDNAGRCQAFTTGAWDTEDEAAAAVLGVINCALPEDVDALAAENARRERACEVTWLDGNAAGLEAARTKYRWHAFTGFLVGLIVAFTMSLLTGCGSTENTRSQATPPPPRPIITAEPLQQSAEVIRKKAQVIETAIDEDPPQIPVVRVAAKEIRDEADTIDAKAETLAVQGQEEQDRATAAEAEVVEVQAKVTELKSDSRRQYNRLWMWIMGLGALAAAAGIPLAIWVSRSLGIGLVVSGASVAVLAYVMTAYLWLIMLCFGALLIACLAWLGWQARQNLFAEPPPRKGATPPAATPTESD